MARQVNAGGGPQAAATDPQDAGRPHIGGNMSDTTTIATVEGVSVPTALEPQADPLAALMAQPELLARFPVETLERLFALRERAQADTARRQYHEAFADFQATNPVVRKLREAKIESTRTGAKFTYNYADASDAVDQLGPDLFSRGFSYSFNTEVSPDGRMCTVECRMHHVGGHSESARVTLPTESSAAMSPQQKIGAARSFAKRLAFFDVLGLFTADAAPEAATAGMEPITAEQAANVQVMLDELPEARRAAFFKWVGFDRSEDIPANRYGEVVAALEKARKGGGA